jgi:hypothetical protein
VCRVLKAFIPETIDTPMVTNCVLLFVNLSFRLNRQNLSTILPGPSSWSYGSWIYSFLCNQCPSPRTLWVWIPLRRGVFDIHYYVIKFVKWLATGPGIPVSSTNTTYRHDKTEIMLKVALNTIILPTSFIKYIYQYILHMGLNIFHNLYVPPEIANNLFIRFITSLSSEYLTIT